MKEIFELFFKNMVFPIWIKDINFNFIFANDAYAELLGREIDEIVGFRNEDLFNEEICKNFESACIKVVESGQNCTNNIYVFDGYKQCSLMPLRNSDNEIIAIAGIVMDIGIIKEKEKEIEIQKSLTKQIMDLLPGVIFYKDKDNKYVYANKGCRDFYKERGIDKIIGKTDREINPNKEQVERFINDDKKIMETKEPIFYETMFENVNGEKIYKDVVKMPFLDDNGEIKGIVGRSLDITESKRYQEKLEYLSYTDILTGVKNRTAFEEIEKKLSAKEYLPLGVIMGDANGLKLVNDTFGHGEGDNLIIEIATVLKEVCSNNEEVFRLGGDEFVVLVPNASLKDCEELIGKILKSCEEYKNDFFNISISLGASIKYSSNDDIYDVLKEAEDKVYRQKLLQNRSIKSSILNSLKIGLDVRSGETEQHTERVAAYAVKVGEILGLEMSEIDELKIAADFHDIGKIGISEDILLKQGELTEAEYEIMKTHSEKGYRIIKASSELKNVAQSVLYHHERWDGKGYPMGLKGEEIPLLARIISVCDAYDVMTSGRIYKKNKNNNDAIEELIKCSGTQFDSKVVEAFIKMKSKILNS